MNSLKLWAVRYSLSLWLLIAILILSAFFVRPTAGSFFVLLIETGLLFLLRAVARLEGKAQIE